MQDANSAKNNLPYTYIDAGFNGFFRRTLDSNPISTRLDSRQPGARQQAINFDQQQTSGFLGDVVQFGRITIDGKNGKVSIYDENKNEVARLGPLEI